MRDVDPEIPAYDMRTMDERLERSRSLRAAYSWMLGVFAVMALLLALGGSYGVTSYLVSQRTRELGIRVAIGAGRLLASLLFGVPPYDILILTIAALALFSTGFLANWLPARRASRVDPMVSLRTD